MPITSISRHLSDHRPLSQHTPLSFSHLYGYWPFDLEPQSQPAIDQGSLPALLKVDGERLSRFAQKGSEQWGLAGWVRRPKKTARLVMRVQDLVVCLKDVWRVSHLWSWQGTASMLLYTTVMGKACLVFTLYCPYLSMTLYGRLQWCWPIPGPAGSILPNV